MHLGAKALLSTSRPSATGPRQFASLAFGPRRPTNVRSARDRPCFKLTNVALCTDRFLDANATLLPYPAEPIRFRTFPDPRLHSGSSFRFIASSCMTPNFPYTPLQGRTIKGLDLLADYLWPAKPQAEAVPLPSVVAEPEQTAETTFASESAPSENITDVPDVNVTIPSIIEEKPAPPTEFMVFMGDFIYADVPVYFGDDSEAYRRLYRRNYNSPSFRKVYERLREFSAFCCSDVTGEN